MLDLGDDNWAQLYHLLSPRTVHTAVRETYFIDRWNDRKNTTLMKSSSEGILRERRDISESLALLAEGEKSES